MFERKIVGMPPAERLGILRFIVAAAAASGVLQEDFISHAYLPLTWYQPQGFMKFFPLGLAGFLLKTPARLACYKIALLLSLGMSAAGLWTRFTLPLSAALYFVFLGISHAYFPFVSWEILPFYLIFFLTWLPCGESFSLDQKIFKRPKDKRPSLANGWAVFLLRAVFCFSFFQAGFSKLDQTGWAWLEPWNLKHFVLQENLASAAGTWTPAVWLASLPDFAWTWIAAALLFSELLLPLALFSWHLRQILPAAVSFLHGIVLISQSIFSLPLFILPLIFYDWDRILPKPFGAKKSPSETGATVHTNLRRRGAATR